MTNQNQGTTSYSYKFNFSIVQSRCRNQLNKFLIRVKQKRRNKRPLCEIHQKQIFLSEISYYPIHMPIALPLTFCRTQIFVWNPIMEDEHPGCSEQRYVVSFFYTWKRSKRHPPPPNLFPRANNPLRSQHKLSSFFCTARIFSCSNMLPSILFYDNQMWIHGSTRNIFPVQEFLLRIMRLSPGRLVMQYHY